MTPRILHVLALSGLLLTPAAAQAKGDQQALAAKRDKKLAATFLKRAAWHKDFAAARAAAAEKGQLILAYFTRSYAP